MQSSPTTKRSRRRHSRWPVVFVAGVRTARGGLYPGGHPHGEQLRRRWGASWVVAQPRSRRCDPVLPMAYEPDVESGSVSRVHRRRQLPGAGLGRDLAHEPRVLHQWVLRVLAGTGTVCPAARHARTAVRPRRLQSRLRDRTGPLPPPPVAPMVPRRPLRAIRSPSVAGAACRVSAGTAPRHSSTGPLRWSRSHPATTASAPSTAAPGRGSHSPAVWRPAPC